MFSRETPVSFISYARLPARVRDGPRSTAPCVRSADVAHRRPALSAGAAASPREEEPAAA